MNLDDIDIVHPDAYLAGVPHAQFALLRREAPVFRHREANGPGFWALTRHEDIARVARDPATFSQAPSLFIEDLPAGNLRDSPDVMIKTITSPSAAAAISAWAHRSRAWRHGWPSRRSCGACPVWISRDPW
jgi:hypothetical protein